MYYSQALFPDEARGDHATGHLGGTSGSLPILELGSGWALQWQNTDYDYAVAYLDTLAAQAALLADDIRQRQAGDARLAAAVDASPEAVQP